VTVSFSGSPRLQLGLRWRRKDLPSVFGIKAYRGGRGGGRVVATRRAVGRDWIDFYFHSPADVSIAFPNRKFSQSTSTIVASRTDLSVRSLPISRARGKTHFPISHKVRVRGEIDAVEHKSADFVS